MRWFIEVSSGGEAGPAVQLVVEAPQWQPALQAARSLRGESPDVEGFSIELLEDGFRVIDPATLIRYIVRRAPDGTPLSKPPPPPSVAPPAPSNGENAAPSVSSVPGPSSRAERIAALLSVETVSPRTSSRPARPSTAPPNGERSGTERKSGERSGTERKSGGPRKSIAAAIRNGGQASRPPRPASQAAPAVQVDPDASARRSTSQPPPSSAVALHAVAAAEPAAPRPSAPPAAPEPQVEAHRSVPPQAPPRPVSVAPGAPAQPPRPVSVAPGAPAQPPRPVSVAPAAASISVVPEPLPPAELLFQRGEDPSPSSPLTYREAAWAVPPGTSTDAAVRLLMGMFEGVRAVLSGAKPGKLVYMAIFDHHFIGKPTRPPLATLTWKDWKHQEQSPEIRRLGQTRASMPSGPGAHSLPPQAVSSAATAASVAPVPSTPAPPEAAQAPAAAPVAPAVPPPPAALGPAANEVVAIPPAAPAPLHLVPAPVVPVQGSEVPMAPAAVTPQPVVAVPSAAVAPESPAARPAAVSFPVPSEPPPAPAPAPVAFVPGVPMAAAPVAAAPAAAAPTALHARLVVVPEAASPEPIAPPLPAMPPVEAPAATAAPMTPPMHAPAPPAAPMMPPVDALAPAAAPMMPPIETPAPAVPPPRASAPSTPGMRLSGVELIADLFEVMHDLHFLPDALAGADFVLSLIMEKLPSTVALVHFFDIDAREFVVVRAVGESAGKMLHIRTNEKEPLLAEAMKKGRAVVIEDATDDSRAQNGRWALVGKPCRSLVCAPVEQGGRFLGLIELANPCDGVPFREGDGHAVTYIGQQFAEFLAARGLILDPDRIGD